MYVTNITDPANFFHALRRQVKNEFRMPLVNMSPKSLLRHPKVVSDIKELETGKFQEIIHDSRIAAKATKRVICCTGKVYYDLLDAAEKHKDTSTAIVRFEQLYPLSSKQLAALKKKYSTVKEWCWVQEEPENMGAWTHILRHCPTINWHYIGRDESASPAVGSSKVHAKQQEIIMNQAFAKLK